MSVAHRPNRKMALHSVHTKMVGGEENKKCQTMIRGANAREGRFLVSRVIKQLLDYHAPNHFNQMW